MDFGGQIYLPWQLSEGKVLYKDVVSNFGPLSPYFNSLWFTIFGISLTTVIITNMVILFLCTLILYKIIRDATDNYTATLSCSIFLIGFGFADLGGYGNSNFICPYCHELTHGILLSLLLILLFSRAIYQFHFKYIILLGLCLGMIFLGKSEIFISIIPVVFIGMLLMQMSNRLSHRHLFIVSFIVIITMLATIIYFFLLLSLHMPPIQAFKGVINNWIALLGSKAVNLPQYKTWSGFDKPWENLLRMGRDFVRIVVFTGAIATLDVTIKMKGRSRTGLILGLTGIILLCIVAPYLYLKKFQIFVPFYTLGPALPLIALLGAAILTAICWRQRADPITLARFGPLCMLAAFAFGLSGKVLLNCGLPGLGFAHAMPATIFLVVVLLSVGPQFLKEWQGRGNLFRNLVTIALIIDTAFLFSISNSFYNKKSFPIGKNGDTILTYGPDTESQGYNISMLIEQLRKLPPKATFLIIPEGVMINYLLRKPCPIPFTNFMPVELEIFGETTILKALKENSPDYIVLHQKEAHWENYFSMDKSHGEIIKAWIERNYFNIWEIGTGKDKLSIQRNNLKSGNMENK